MSQHDDTSKNEAPPSTVLDRREFMKRTMVGVGAMATTMVVGGCGSDATPPAAAATPVAATVGTASKTAWKFGVMGDSQWLALDDGYNPNTSAISIITAVQQQLIDAGVKFVVHVGDLADRADKTDNAEAGYPTTPNGSEDTRALFAQPLYNAGIGFFPLRGNHDAGVPTEFARIFPQTQTGQMNATPADVFNALNNVPASIRKVAAPTKSGTAFTIGSNFNSPTTTTDNLKGLTYSFDYQNCRFVLIDQFQPADSKNPDGSAYSIVTTVAQQQPWITSRLAGRPANGHAFVFAHRGLITQQHIDVLFGDCPADADFAAPANPTTGAAAKTYKVAAGGLNTFIKSMASNKAKLYFCGHDHIHNRSTVKTTDDNGASSVTHILCQSCSSKFYTPNENNAFGNSNVTACTSNDAYFCGGKRQTQLSQEVYTVGYYIVTVDGANVTVDYYSAPVFAKYESSTESLIVKSPTLNFTRRETFGYSLLGKQFLLKNGDSYTAVQDTGPSGTTAKILSGTNNNPNVDQSGRQFYNDVNTGWYAAVNTTASDILSLWGMTSILGSDQTDVYTLQMSYDKTKGSSPLLATPDGSGNWVKAVDNNLGGTKKFVQGPWDASKKYPLGTYGIDTAAGTVWAVLNYNGCFAAVNGL